MKYTYRHLRIYIKLIILNGANDVLVFTWCIILSFPLNTNFEVHKLSDRDRWVVYLIWDWAKIVQYWSHFTALYRILHWENKVNLWNIRKILLPQKIVSSYFLLKTYFCIILIFFMSIMFFVHHVIDRYSELHSEPFFKCNNILFLNSHEQFIYFWAYQTLQNNL